MVTFTFQPLLPILYDNQGSGKPSSDAHLKRGPRLGVNVCDVGLFGEGVAAERGRVLDLAPLAAADEVGGRVDLGRNC